MKLPPELFDDIVGVSDLPPSASDADSERRTNRRVAIGSRATIRRLRRGAEGPANIVLLRDVSVASVGFLHNERMREGEAFVIRLTGSKGQQVAIQCVVSRCEAGGTGGMQFVIGATFEAVLEVKDAEPEEIANVAPAVRKLTLREAAREDRADYANKVMGVSADAGNKMPEAAALAGDGTKEDGAKEPEVGKAANADGLSRVDEPEEPTAVAGQTMTAQTPGANQELTEADVVGADVVVADVVVAGAQGSDPAPEVIAAEAEPDSARATTEVVAEPAVVEAKAKVVTEPAVVKEADTEVRPEKHAVTIAERLARSAPQTPSVRGGNQQILARVREQMLSHGNLVRNLAQQLEEVKRQLCAQKLMTAELTQQRDELKATADAAKKQLAEVKGGYSKKAEQLEKELAALNEMGQLLRAKSEADDKAVAELAALLETASGTAGDASQINEHLAMPVPGASSHS